LQIFYPSVRREHSGPLQIEEKDTLQFHHSVSDGAVMHEDPRFTVPKLTFDGSVVFTIQITCRSM
jgi:hypothetical protein